MRSNEDATTGTLQPRRYSHSWYRYLDDLAKSSSEAIVPIVMELISPSSVVDVGCGLGTWLSTFHDHGVAEVLGLDGNQIDPQWLRIPADRFVACDLVDPPEIRRRFDLVVSLEVAEHLPPDSADAFVSFIVGLGPLILFSAAIPFQGGEGHLNEQWPDYWAQHFAVRGYIPIDCIRSRVWANDAVAWWYAQNALLFVQPDVLGDKPHLLELAARTNRSQLALVHPRKYLELHQTELAAGEFAQVVPPDSSVIFVDQEQLRGVVSGSRSTRPFLEKKGQYWGLPSNAAEAIKELERMRGEGSRFLVFAWPAFWWLDFYSEFIRYLKSTYSLVLTNDRLIIFDLQ